MCEIGIFSYISALAYSLVLSEEQTNGFAYKKRFPAFSAWLKANSRPWYTRDLEWLDIGGCKTRMDFQKAK